MKTRYEMCITNYKGKLQATLYDEYWDKITNLFYGPGSPETATGIGHPTFNVEMWKALAPQIATIGTGWYAIEMPDEAYPFGKEYSLIAIPDRHRRWKDANRAKLPSPRA